MSVISVREIWKGRASSNEFGVSRDSTRVFRVWTDNRYDTDAIIESDPRLPAPFSPHPNDIGKYAKKMKCDQNEKTPCLWIVTVTYATPDKREDEDADNPLERRAKVNVTTQQRKKRMERAQRQQADGSFTPGPVAVVNSVGKVFEKLPDVDDSVYHVTVEKNIPPDIPPWFFGYKDSVNSDAFTLRGQLVAAGLAAILTLGIGDIQVENGVSFAVFRAEMLIDPDGHDVPVLDTGYEVEILDDDGFIIGTKKITDAEGVLVKEPQLLNGHGQELEDDEPEAYIVYRPKKRKPFNQLPLT